MINHADTDHPIFRRLKKKIVSGDYLPNMALRPNDIADELGTSAVPVREALIRLSERGFVDYRHRLGFEVARYDPLEQIEISLIMINLYERSIPTIYGAANSTRLIQTYKAIVMSELEKAQSDADFQERCVKAFHELLLPRPVGILLGQLYDMSYFGRSMQSKTQRDMLSLHIRRSVILLEQQDLGKIVNTVTKILRRRIADIKASVGVDK